MPDRNILLTDIQLLERISPLAEKVVGRYVAKKAIPRREQEDIQQGILEKFIRSKEKILTSFEGKSQFKTYCIAVLNRMCCEIIRNESKHWYAVSEMEQAPQEDISPDFITEKRTLLKQEIKRLDEAMLFFNGSRAKYNVFIRYFNDIPLNENYIMQYSPGNEKQIFKLLNTGKTKKGDKFKILADVVRIVENKDVKGDAVRMWLNKQTGILLERMNKSGDSNYTSESLAILLEVSENKAY